MNSELNDDIGNYVHRVLSFIKSRYGGVVPEPGDMDSVDEEFKRKIEEVPRRAGEFLEQARIKPATEAILDLPRAGNQYLNARAPWDTYKTDPGSAATTIWLAVNAVRSIAVMLAPFMPSAAQRLWEMLGMEGRVHQQKWDTASQLLVRPGHRIGKPRPLFAKLPPDFLEKIGDQLAQVRRAVQERRPPVLR